MSTIGLFQWMNEIWQLVPEREDIRMSQQKDLLREIAAASSSGSPDRISDWFTEELPWLKGRDLELVMGEALCNWVGWSRPG